VTAHPRQTTSACVHYTTNMHSIWFDETGQVVYIVWTGESSLPVRIPFTMDIYKTYAGLDLNFDGKFNAGRKTPPGL
jgi:hypothetical protein